MATKTITIELTEGQAAIARWALERAHMTAPKLYRTPRFKKELDEARAAVDAATAHLAETPVAFPMKKFGKKV